MFVNSRAFYGLVQTTLVRDGLDCKLLDGGNTMEAVYSEMLWQICRDYPGLPDPRTLKRVEIRFFYDGLRAELREATK